MNYLIVHYRLEHEVFIIENRDLEKNYSKSELRAFVVVKDFYDKEMADRYVVNINIVNELIKNI